MLPITASKLDEIREGVGIIDLKTATIRQICALAAALEKESEETFVRLELGNPGLPPEKIGIESECEALKRGVAGVYPDIKGIPELKSAGSHFVKAFFDLKIPSKYIIPTVGSMQGSFTLMTLLKQRIPHKNTILFFNPGFSAQRHQAKLIGLNIESFDIYEYRGEKLKDKLEEILSEGNITAMLYSNPNNPSWSNFTEEELKIIGEAATRHDVIVLEDLAYLGMDFRQDFSKPHKAPYIPSVGNYTAQYILLISASKIFSYAGQRVAIVCMSPEVYERKYKSLSSFYEMANFGDSYIFGVLYSCSSGVCHSAQFAMAAMLEAAAKGELDFIRHTKEYEIRCARLKDLFHKYGFHIVYDKDCEDPISDGFFFTAGYKDWNSVKLQNELLRFGISSISLPGTGSLKEGIRVCVSALKNDQDFTQIESRLKKFSGVYYNA